MSVPISWQNPLPSRIFPYPSVHEIGRVAAELVIAVINNPELRPLERLVDSAELVVRPSTVGMADGTR